VTEIAQRLLDGRRLSVLVVDDQQRPMGRILADDIVDALVAGPDRFRITGHR
jgi:Mg/Co/Ni transporter MgtE